MGTKKLPDELAIFGGTPTFNEALHVGRPNIGDRVRLMQRIVDLLDRRWLTNNGPYVQELEKKVAGMLQVRNCIAMCNGTIALEIAIRANGLGGEVIVPSFTFAATAHALEWQGIEPVFCDIDSQTHNIDPSSIERAITPRTTGIIGVHLWGRPCEMDAIIEIARKHHLKLLFDAAHAFGCTYKGQMLGNFGNAEILSFHATKFINAFEGGAVVTNDDALASKMRLMRNFGFAGYDKVVSVGTNGKMTEVAAAMGLTSLESFDEFVATNHRNYKLYQHELANLPGVRLLTYDENEAGNYQYIVVEIDESITQVSRNRLVEVLWAENILARRYFYPGCHRMEPYWSRRKAQLPETDRVANSVLCLPTGTAVGADEISTICGIIRLVLANPKALNNIQTHSRDS
jgi:dTDP-4-amino-4,6-dideoxygalactose transaminase